MNINIRLRKIKGHAVYTNTATLSPTQSIIVSQTVSHDGKRLYANLISFRALLLRWILYFNVPFQDAESYYGLQLILLHFKHKF
jgi:hypothetical protein